MNRDELNVCLSKLADILLWCFLLSIILSTIWFVFYLVGGDWAYRLHSSWFSLSPHEFVMANYYGLAFVKLIIFLFFFIPYLAIKVVLRKKN
ncbi:MAG: DUF6868 family protein [bacterium]